MYTFIKGKMLNYGIINSGDAMVTVDMIIQNLELNQNISLEVKSDIKELINQFRLAMPDVDLATLNEKIATLNIKAANKFVVKKAARYNEPTNTMEFNPDELNEGYDCKHLMMIELLYVIASGHQKSEEFIALYEGYAATLSNFIVGNNSEKLLCQDSEIFTNLINCMLPSETIKKAFFEGKEEELKMTLFNLSTNPKLITDILDLSRYNSIHMEDSLIDKTQILLIELFNEQVGIDYEMLTTFEANLFKDVSFFNEGNRKYPLETNVAEIFNSSPVVISLQQEKEANIDSPSHGGRRMVT